MVLVAGVSVFRMSAAPWRGLDDFTGKDLRKLDKATDERLYESLKPIFPKFQSFGSWGPRPWALAKFDNGREPLRWVCFEVDTTLPHPGTTRLKLHTWNAATRKVRVSEFTTGCRVYVKGFALKKRSISDGLLLELETGYGGPEKPVGRQVYARLGDEWVLIRVEWEGKAGPPKYAWRPSRAGPEYRPFELPSVLDSLDSDNAVEQLLALTWLGAFHQVRRDPAEWRYGQAQGDVDFVEAARSHPGIRARVEALTKSSEPWVAEAAALALHPER